MAWKALALAEMELVYLDIHCILELAQVEELEKINHISA
jgi:hypothetical protein